MKNSLTKKIIILSVKLIVAALVVVLLCMPFIYPLPVEIYDAWSKQLLSLIAVYTGELTTDFYFVKIIASIVIIAGLYFATTVGCLILELVCSRKNRSKTVAGLIISIVKTVVFIAGIVWVLYILGLNIAAIFASLGVVSLIIGFGVQSLIEDCITGIFIIIEGQFNIGDIVVLGDFRGVVKKINIRTTTLIDAGGNLKIVNNSDIRNIQNRSNETSIAISDISIAYEQDIRIVEKLFSVELPKLYEANKGLFLEAPTYLGVQQLGASGVVLRVIVKCKEEDVFIATRKLNRDLKVLFDDNGITIPFTQVVIHKAEK